MRAQPLTKPCHTAYSKRVHACFGVSPFNSYFSELKIQELAQWGIKEFRSIHFFVPDGPAAFTLEAIGYSPEEAKRKARQQGKYTFNKIHRALMNSGKTYVDAMGMIINWETLQENKRFLELHSAAQSLFETHPEFRNSCIEATKWVLENKVTDEKDLTAEKLNIAVKYFLAEIPLFADAAGILNQESSVFCYHQSIPFLEKLYQRSTNFPVSRNQGFVITSPLNRASFHPQELHSSEATNQSANEP